MGLKGSGLRDSRDDIQAEHVSPCHPFKVIVLGDLVTGLVSHLLPNLSPGAVNLTLTLVHLPTRESPLRRELCLGQDEQTLVPLKGGEGG